MRRELGPLSVWWSHKPIGIKAGLRMSGRFAAGLTVHRQGSLFCKLWSVTDQHQRTLIYRRGVMRDTRASLDIHRERAHG